MNNPSSLGIFAFLFGLMPFAAYEVAGYTPDKVLAYKQTVNSGGSPVTLLRRAGGNSRHC